MNTVEISCTDENTTPPVIAALTATKNDAIIKFEKGNKKYYNIEIYILINL